jgi:bacterioferritin (cytochrome b1)
MEVIWTRQLINFVIFKIQKPNLKHVHYCIKIAQTSAETIDYNLQNEFKEIYVFIKVFKFHKLSEDYGSINI